MIVAIDIGGTKLQMARYTAGPEGLHDVRVLKTDRDRGREGTVEQIAATLREWHAIYPISSIGVGFGGPVNFPFQQVYQSTHVGGWNDFDLLAFLADVVGPVPMLMDNDANVGGLGEAFAGAGQGSDPLFYMTLSTGIGGGIILDGNRVLRGPDSYAGELGHITLYPDGPPCLCGSQGCFERMCAGLWLERDHGKPVPELLGDDAFLIRYTRDLARGLKPVIMLLNPARIVIGGGISKAGERLFTPLRDALRREIPAWSRARLDVVPAALGDNSVLWGCVVLAQQAMKEQASQ